MTESYLSLVPGWRSDETLFSWCAAFHRLDGGGSTKRTSVQLFGVSHAARFVHAPRHLTHFCRVSRGLLGSPEQVLDERTLFGYFTRFSTLDQVRLATAGALTIDGSMATSQVGQKLRGIVRESWLKGCRICLEESRRKFELSFWRRPHQLPMALLCLRHREPLQLWDGSRSRWVLPEDEAPCRTVSTPNRTLKVAALLLTTAEHTIFSHVGICDPARFRNSTITALQRIEVLRSHRRIEENKVMDWLNASGAWRSFKQNNDASANADIGDLAELLIRDRRRGHPALWALLWAAIAESDTHAFSWLEAALEEQSAPSQLALDLDVQPSSELPPGLDEVLMECETLGEAALRLRVCAHTLRRWLGRDAALRQQWCRTRHEERKRRATANIRSFIQANPQASRGDLMLVCKADACWLQIHEKNVLDDLLSAVHSNRARQRSLFADARDSSGKAAN